MCVDCERALVERRKEQARRINFRIGRRNTDELAKIREKLNQPQPDFKWLVGAAESISL